MKPMKVVRRKHQNDNKKKIILFTAIGFVLVALIVAGLYLYRDFISVNKYKKIEAEQRTKFCAINDGQNVSMKVKVGDMCMLTVPEDINLANVEYISSKEEILSVDSGGRVDFLSEGQAMITVKGPLFEGYCNFTVEKADDNKKDEGIVSSAITANLDYLNKNLDNEDEYPYLLQVNRQTNVVTVFTYDEGGRYVVPVRAMVCSCGTSGDDITPTGDYQVEYKARWNALFGDCFGQYISGFNGDILFHSVPYFTQNADDLETQEFNKLGQNASQGCVRLTVSDAKWIYDNCDICTQVKVIDKSESADSLGKPATIKLSKDEKWDPTDPDENNPFLKKAPVIEGAEDKEIKVGEEYNMLDGIKAVDTCSNDITSEVKVTGNVITKKKGVYYVTYDVIDGLGKEVVKTIKVTVK